MQAHNLKRITKRKKSVQVGRGGKRGKTSGRGTKGQKARAGNKRRPEMRDIIKKIPKLRGRGKSAFTSTQTKPSIINLDVLTKFVNAGDEVTPNFLVEKGAIEKLSGKIPRVKILGDGEISVKIVVSNCTLSASAKEKIEKAGGKINQ
jgi:large subunit ribosomal protein L15